MQRSQTQTGTAKRIRPSNMTRAQAFCACKTPPVSRSLTYSTRHSG